MAKNEKANEVLVKRLRDIANHYEMHVGQTTLKDVIKLLSGYDVVPYDSKNGDDVEILEKLKKVAQTTVEVIQNVKIKAARPNEAGNMIEPYVIDALNKVGYNAHVPEMANGGRKAVGYPDIAFTDDNGKLNYVECKTYNSHNINTTLRSFYLSPSDDFKITCDAHHFIISFEFDVVPGNKVEGMNVYITKGWMILDAANLPVELKTEFNSNNRLLYGENHELILSKDSNI